MPVLPPLMKGKGILYALSNITRPDILDEPTYLKWYEDDHIVETISASGIHSGRRFINVDPNADKPYLAMYPLDDMAFTQTEEFAKIGVSSDLLPGTGFAFDVADFAIRHDSLVDVYDPVKKGKGAARTLVAVGTELKEGSSEEDLEKWYREEQLPFLSKHRSYLRSTRFKHLYLLTNRRAYVLKGIKVETDEAEPEPPAWLALHEFEAEADSSLIAELKDLVSSPSQKIKGILKSNEVNIYKLGNEFGEKDWFYGVEL